MKKDMNFVSCGPSPACTSGVTSNTTFVPSSMSSVCSAGPRSGPWCFLPPVLHRSTPVQFGCWLAMLVSVEQFHVTPEPEPFGLPGVG